MKIHTKSIALATLFVFASLFVVVTTTYAGPPLICHLFDIGSAKSLPWISHGWDLSGSENYDTRRLSEDTLAILSGSEIPLVHMETLRRATLYARKDPQAAKQLLLQLVARAESSAASAHPDALAYLDAAYVIEAYKQWIDRNGSGFTGSLDGIPWIAKAVQLRPSDAQLNFAAALISLRSPEATQQRYSQAAISGAKNDPLLARNLNSRFLGQQSQSMAEMITANREERTARQ